MESKFELQPPVLKVSLAGDLTGGSDAMRFGHILRDELAQATGVTDVAIDVTGVQFVNSSGLGMLLAARQAALDHGASLALLHPGEQLRGLLDITKLSEILGVS